jgi:hypothetical protein
MLPPDQRQQVVQEIWRRASSLPLRFNHAGEHPRIDVSRSARHRRGDVGACRLQRGRDLFDHRPQAERCACDPDAHYLPRDAEVARNAIAKSQLRSQLR